MIMEWLIEAVVIWIVASIPIGCAIGYAIGVMGGDLEE
jgi:hypothetical protein